MNQSFTYIISSTRDGINSVDIRMAKIPMAFNFWMKKGEGAHTWWRV